MIKLLKIDDATRAGYSYLRPNDDCFYWREYTSGQNLSNASETNQLIWNLKKCPSKKTSNPPEFRYKIRAIQQVAHELNRLLNPASGNFDKSLFVPVPPSKSHSDPLYDDRLLRILNLRLNNRLASNPIISQKVSTDASHKGNRLPPAERKNNYQCLEVDLSAYERIIVFDDLITTGSHFVAISDILQEKFSLPVVGLFIARTIHTAPDFDDFDF